MGLIKTVKSEKFLEQAKRLNRFMQSVDADLKKIAQIMNENAHILNSNVKELDARMQKIEEMLHGKKP